MRKTLIISLTAVVATAAATSALAGGADPLGPRTTIGPHGAGAVRIGMTVREAERATGQRFASLGEPQPGSDCSYVVAKRGPRGLAFMLKGRRIVRVDLSPPGTLRTTRGIGRGNTEAVVRRAYPKGLRTEPHHYVPKGHYLVFTPAEKRLRNRRVIFETDGRKVTAIRAGRVPEVRFVEGCS